MEGFALGLLLIGGAMFFIGLCSGGAQTGAGLTMMIIVAIFIAVRIHQEKPADDALMEQYRKMYPGWTDAEIRAYRAKKRAETQRRMNKR